jgi:hypothetical protein
MNQNTAQTTTAPSAPSLPAVQQNAGNVPSNANNPRVSADPQQNTEPSQDGVQEWTQGSDSPGSEKSVSPRRPKYLGTFFLGEDGLDMRVSSVSASNAKKTVRVKYELYNDGKNEAIVGLTDPLNKAFMVDSAGATFAFAGAEGLDDDEIIVPPQSRVNCTLLFKGENSAVEAVEQYVNWNIKEHSAGVKRTFSISFPANAFKQ